VATEASRQMLDNKGKNTRDPQWVGKLPAHEKDDALTRLSAVKDLSAVTGLLRRFMGQYDKGNQGCAEQLRRRNVGELLRLGEGLAEQRRQLAARRPPMRRRDANGKRRCCGPKHLDKIAGREPAFWNEVGT